MASHRPENCLKKELGMMRAHDWDNCGTVKKKKTIISNDDFLEASAEHLSHQGPDSKKLAVVVYD